MNEKDRETLLKTVIDVRLEEKYFNAKNIDWETLPEEEYLAILDIITSSINLNVFEKAEQPLLVVRDTRAQIKELLGKRTKYNNSELIKWAKETLDRIGKLCPQIRKEKKAAPPTNDPRKKLEASKAINKRTLEIFEKYKKDPAELFKQLEQLIERKGESMNLVNVATILYNFSNMIDVPRELLTKITDLIDQKRENMGEQETSTALYGLKNLGPESVPPELTEAIGKKLEQSSEAFGPIGIGNSLYGLQNLNSKAVSPRLLKELLKRIEANPEELNSFAIANGLYGIIELQDMPEARKIQENLCEHIELLRDLPISKGEIMYLVQVFHYNERRVPIWLNRKYEKCLVQEPDEPTPHEMTAATFFRRLYRGESIRTNHYVDGIELDIFFPERKINIETDGYYHATRGLRDQRRDNYLEKNYGIKTIRIPCSKDIEEFFEHLKTVDLEIA